MMSTSTMSPQAQLEEKKHQTTFTDGERSGQTYYKSQLGKPGTSYNLKEINKDLCKFVQISKLVLKENKQEEFGQHGVKLKRLARWCYASGAVSKYIRFVAFLKVKR